MEGPGEARLDCRGRCYRNPRPLPERCGWSIAVTEQRQKYHLSACNPIKLDVLDELLQKHPNDQTLIIGMYLDQLAQVEQRFGFPIITGNTPEGERRKLYHQFRNNEIQHLIISKVGNFAIDLPDASVMIRLRRLAAARRKPSAWAASCAPKSDGQMAHFYTIVTKDTQDQDFGANRQLFLTEQGYQYWILYGDEVNDFQPRTLAGASFRYPCSHCRLPSLRSLRKSSPVAKCLFSPHVLP